MSHPRVWACPSVPGDVRAVWDRYLRRWRRHGTADTWACDEVAPERVFRFWEVVATAGPVTEDVP